MTAIISQACQTARGGVLPCVDLNQLFQVSHRGQLHIHVGLIIAVVLGSSHESLKLDSQRLDVVEGCGRADSKINLSFIAFEHETLSIHMFPTTLLATCTIVSVSTRRKTVNKNEIRTTSYWISLMLTRSTTSNGCIIKTRMQGIELSHRLAKREGSRGEDAEDFGPGVGQICPEECRVNARHNHEDNQRDHMVEDLLQISTAPQGFHDGHTLIAILMSHALFHISFRARAMPATA